MEDLTVKNLLIYINPRRGFDREHRRLVKIQIDNSLGLGWAVVDILLITNFEYKYRGIEAVVLPDDVYCEVHDRASKVNAVCCLFGMDLIQDREMYWLHDFDAFQIRHISEDELGLAGYDLGLTDYGWSLKWNTGSIFFKAGAADLFKLIKDAVYELQTDEERALVALTKDNASGINSRYKRMNIKYNLGMRKIDFNLGLCGGEPKVLHFHPRKPGLLEQFRPLMPQRLVEVFREHGYS